MKTLIAGVPTYSEYVRTVPVGGHYEAVFRLPQAVKVYEDGRTTTKTVETLSRSEIADYVDALARAEDALPTDRANRMKLIGVLVKGYEALGGRKQDLIDTLGTRFGAVVKEAAPVLKARKSIATGQSPKAARAGTAARPA